MRRGDAAQEPVGERDEDARAVARVLLGAARAAVLEVGEHGERVAHDRVRGPAGDVRDEPEAAAVVLGGRFVQGLRSDHGALRTNP